MDGKRQSRRPPQLISAVGSSNLLHVPDTHRNVEYLIDSGAQVSVFPYESSRKPCSHLTAADGRRIPAWGTVSLPVVLNGRSHGLQQFVRAAVGQPILGADFLYNTGLLIDVRHHRLVPPSQRAADPPPSRSQSPPPSGVLSLSASSPSVQPKPPQVVRAGPPAVGTTMAPASGQLDGELHTGPSRRPTPVQPPQGVRAGSPAIGTSTAATVDIQQSGELHKGPLDRVLSYADVVRMNRQPPQVVRARPPATGATVAALMMPPAFAKLLDRYTNVTNKKNVKFAGSPAHGVRHHIVMSGPPTFARARSLDTEKLTAAKEEFDAMI